jgi:branched-chain amino acid transport system ATP-binding protein
MQFGGLKAGRDLDLTIAQGELVGLIGPNGAGKTTVFNVITGVYAPTAPSDVREGVPIQGQAHGSRSGHHAHVPEHPAVLALLPRQRVHRAHRTAQLVSTPCCHGGSTSEDEPRSASAGDELLESRAGLRGQAARAAVRAAAPASRSRARSPAARACCCSTSPPPAQPAGERPPMH